MSSNVQQCMKEHIWNYVVNKKVLNKPEYVFIFYILQSSHLFALMTALHTLGILSVRFMRSSRGHLP